MAPKLILLVSLVSFALAFSRSLQRHSYMRTEDHVEKKSQTIEAAEDKIKAEKKLLEAVEIDVSEIKKFSEAPTLQLSSSQPESNFAFTTEADLGGTPGFAAFENVYLCSGVAHLVRGVSQSLDLKNTFPPGKTNVSSVVGASHYYKFSSVVDNDFDFLQGQPMRIWDDVTYLIDDKSYLYLGHYFHQIEHWVGAYAIWKEKYPRTPVARILLPGFDVDLEKSFSLVSILNSLWPGHQRFYQPAFNASGCTWIKHGILSSRAAVRQNLAVQQANKMDMAHVLEIKPHVQSLVEAAYHGMGIHPGTQQGLVIIVDRGDTRDLAPSVRQAFAISLFSKPLQQLTIQIVKFQDIPFQQQIQTAARAHIMVGRHGNGLTHAIWMARSSVVMEIFPTGGWANDYQLLAEMAGHRHVACEGSFSPTVPAGRCLPFSYVVGTGRCPIMGSNRTATREGLIQDPSLGDVMANEVVTLLGASMWPPAHVPCA